MFWEADAAGELVKDGVSSGNVSNADHISDSQGLERITNSGSYPKPLSPPSLSCLSPTLPRSTKEARGNIMAVARTNAETHDANGPVHGDVFHGLPTTNCRHKVLQVWQGQVRHHCCQGGRPSAAEASAY